MTEFPRAQKQDMNITSYYHTTQNKTKQNPRKPEKIFRSVECEKNNEREVVVLLVTITPLDDGACISLFGSRLATLVVHSHHNLLRWIDSIRFDSIDISCRVVRSWFCPIVDKTGATAHGVIFFFFFSPNRDRVEMNQSDRFPYIVRLTIRERTYCTINNISSPTRARTRWDCFDTERQRNGTTGNRSRTNVLRATVAVL